MTYRRTWFSCVLWFLYTIMCIILLAICGAVCVRYFAGLSGNALLVSGLLVIPAAAALYWIVRGIATRIRKKRVWKERSAQIIGLFAFLLIMAGGVLIRVICLNNQLLPAGSDGFINAGGMEFYDMAVVTQEEFVSSIDYGISDLYVMLLSVVLSFLGNKIISAVFLQVFLQITGLVLVYAVTRKIAGRLPACIALLYLSGSLCCLRMIVCFGPEWLFFVFYMFGMLMSVSFIKNYCENHIRKPLAVVGAAVIGVMIGGLTYLDLTAVSLLIVVLAVAVGKKTQPGKMPVRNSGGISATVILTAVFVCVAVWVGAMGAVSYVRETDLISAISDRLWLCYHNSYPFTNMEPYFLDIYMVGMLIIPASFLVFEFFRSGKEQNYMLWILMCLLVAPTPIAVYGEHGFGMLSLFVWAVLAGLGIQNCLFGGQVKVMQAVIERINTAAEQAQQAEKHVNPEKTANTRQSTEVQEQEQQIAGTATVKEAQQPEMTENQVTKPRYIENPLPLPKKHVARGMDYRYAVEEKDMKYDVEVPDDDDFDVQ